MPLSPLFEKKINEWDTMVDVNITGVLYGIAAVLPSMRERKSRDFGGASQRRGRKQYSLYHHLAGSRCQ
nr:hypothetical protein [Paenibacillus popilliae]